MRFCARICMDGSGPQCLDSQLGWLMTRRRSTSGRRLVLKFLTVVFVSAQGERK